MIARVSELEKPRVPVEIRDLGGDSVDWARKIGSNRYSRTLIT
jgi:hypothetical protein